MTNKCTHELLSDCAERGAWGESKGGREGGTAEGSGGLWKLGNPLFSYVTGTTIN